MSKMQYTENCSLCFTAEEQLMNQNTILIMIVVGLAVVIFLIVLYCFQQRNRSPSHSRGRSGMSFSLPASITYVCICHLLFLCNWNNYVMKISQWYKKNLQKSLFYSIISCRILMILLNCDRSLKTTIFSWALNADCNCWQVFFNNSSMHQLAPTSITDIIPQDLIKKSHNKQGNIAWEHAWSILYKPP